VFCLEKWLGRFTGSGAPEIKNTGWGKQNKPKMDIGPL
jgi:hypothetical protein